MFNITDNFQPLTDEQLTEVTGGGLIGGTVSAVNPALGTPVAGASNFLTGTVTTGATIVSGVTTTVANGGNSVITNGL